MTESPDLDYYLVFTGPTSTAMSSAGGTRPWLITAVYLFDAVALLAEQRARNVKVGVFSSVRNPQWAAAEIYPTATCPALTTTTEQRQQLRLFGG
jgi:hypothetical protein